MRQSSQGRGRGGLPNTTAGSASGSTDLPKRRSAARVNWRRGPLRHANHVVHGIGYAAVLCGEAIGMPLGHTVKICGYSILMGLPFILLSHAFFVGVIRRIWSQ